MGAYRLLWVSEAAPCTPRIVEEWVEELLSDLAALSVEVPKVVGKTLATLDRCPPRALRRPSQGEPSG